MTGKLPWSCPPTVDSAARRVDAPPVPGIVRPKRPQMTLGITTGIPLLSIDLGLQGEDNLGALGTGARIMRFNIPDKIIAALCFCAADFVRLPHKSVDLEAGNGAEHDDRLSERQLRVTHAPMGIAADSLKFKAKRVRKPFDGGFHVAVA